MEILSNDVARLIGDSPNRRKVYLGLLLHEYMKTDVLARKVGLEPNNVSSVLTYLRKQGLINSEPVRPGSRALKHKRLEKPALPQGGDGVIHKRKQPTIKHKGKKTTMTDVLVALAAMQKQWEDFADVVTKAAENYERLQKAEEKMDELAQLLKGRQ